MKWIRLDKSISVAGSTLQILVEEGFTVYAYRHLVHLQIDI